MLRNYKTGTKEGVGLFTGKEIEHTLVMDCKHCSAKNGLHMIKLKISVVDAEAVYFGANRRL